jgi:NADH dehydrogenase
MTQERVPRVLIVGGGYVGMYAALRLQKKLRRSNVRITVVDPRSYMTYQPFLPEAAAGSLEPRHVIVPLRRTLKHCQVITGRVTSVNHAERTARVEPHVGEPYDMSYDVLVMAVGSIARTLPIPGLADFGIGFKQVEEAIAMRNHVLDRLDVAASTGDEKARQRALSFVVVGGGYAGVEALAELQDMAVDALRYYPYLKREHMRWVLVEAANRILPEVGEEMGRYTVDELRRHGIDVKLNTRLESVVDGHVVLSDGTEFDSETLIWTAGVKANPMLANTDLPLDEKGRLRCRADLRVEGVDGAWAAGDAAAVPDLTSDVPGATTTPSAIASRPASAAILVERDISANAADCASLTTTRQPRPDRTSVLTRLVAVSGACATNRVCASASPVPPWPGPPSGGWGKPSASRAAAGT